jgi:hypothetical protein
MSYSRRPTGFDLSMIEAYNRRTPYPGASASGSTGYPGMYMPPPGYHTVPQPHVRSHYDAPSSRSHYGAHSSSSYYGAPPPSSYYDAHPSHSYHPDPYANMQSSHRQPAPQPQRSYYDTERRFPCPEPGCGRRYESNHAMARHHTEVHARERLHACQYCGNEFARPGSLYRHIRNVHHESADRVPSASRSSSRRHPHASVLGQFGYTPYRR